MNPRAFLAVAWLPLALLLGAQFYVSQFEGWGRWAGAPLFLVPVVASAVLAVMGVAICRREARARRPVTLIASATLAAAIPALWFVARLLAS